jgi:uncharacterized protein (TIGR03067 family)
MTNKAFCLIVTAGLSVTRVVSPAQDQELTRRLPGQITLLDDHAAKNVQTIFNGKDLTGWEGNPKLWSVQDGALTGQTFAEDPIKGNTFLIWTNGTVGDFELRCRFRIQPKNTEGFANSGIQYRSVVLDPGGWVVGGYQADMEAGPTYTGILYEERMTRGIMAARGEKVVWNKDCKKDVVGSLGTSEELQAAIHQGDWNDYVIIAKGNHLQHFINGKQTVDVVDECESKRAMNGVLALQLHAGKPMLVQFKDMKLTTLGSGSATTGTANDGVASQADELKLLQGVWRATRAEENGTAVSAHDIPQIVVTIKGSKFQVMQDGEQHDKGSFTLDPSKSPKQIDIHHESDSGDVMEIPAIYEVGPDTLRVCYARQRAPRPKAFETASDPRLYLISYKRTAQAP